MHQRGLHPPPHAHTTPHSFAPTTSRRVSLLLSLPPSSTTATATTASTVRLLGWPLDALRCASPVRALCVGFPRTLEQAKRLEGLFPPRAVINVDVPHETSTGQGARGERSKCGSSFQLPCIAHLLWGSQPCQLWSA
jgi:hypothetical protein